MPIELYHFIASAPSRMVRLLAEHLGLELELKDVDIMKGEQFQPEFLQVGDWLEEENFREKLTARGRSKVLTDH